MWPWTHDEYYCDVTPGLLPTGPSRTRRVRWRREWNPQVAVSFVPPRGASPALYGTLVDSRVDPGDLAAMLVDLAQRGWFGLRREAGDWRLDLMPTVPAGDSASLAEQRLLVALFGGGLTRVRLRSRREPLRESFEEVAALLLAEAVGQGWYRRSPRPRGWSRLRGRSPRTAAGSAARVSLLGFRQYLATAEAEQIRDDERRHQFSRYLPWALALGLTDEWAQVVRELSATGDLGLAGGFDPSGSLLTALDLGGDVLGAVGGVAQVAELVAGVVDLFGAVADLFDGLG